MQSTKALSSRKQLIQKAVGLQDLSLVLRKKEVPRSPWLRQPHFSDAAGQILKSLMTL
jgi:hypothetical protein